MLTCDGFLSKLREQDMMYIMSETHQIYSKIPCPLLLDLVVTSSAESSSDLKVRLSNMLPA